MLFDNSDVTLFLCSILEINFCKLLVLVLNMLLNLNIVSLLINFSTSFLL